MTDTDDMIYATEEPDVKVLTEAYHSAINELDEYFDTCQQAHDDRRNIWVGKTADMRKHGPTAFPWDGASDIEVNVVGERLDTYVSLFDQALQRSHIKAFATNTQSLPRAAVVSQFIKWMRNSWIPNFKQQMELAGNHLLEKGFCVSYVGWKRETRSFLQAVTLQEIAEGAPELADMIVSDMDVKDIAGVFRQAFPEVSDKRLRKAVKSLRDKGEAEIPIPRLSIDCPLVQTCSPDGDVIFPSYVTDPQAAPYVFHRTFLTAQELEKRASNDGWDKDWVEDAIEKLRGVDSYKIDGEKQRYNERQTITQDDKDLVMVICCYQRLIDEEDGSEGIYRTVFHPNLEGYAKHELLSGFNDYPFVVTRLEHSKVRLYETRPMTVHLRGPQQQIKTERDSRVDRASLATMPPLMHPAGRAPTTWGPGARVPYRRLGELQFGPQPPPDSGSIEVENSMRVQADTAIGLAKDDPLSQSRQQYYVGKFLDHVRGVLALAFELYQKLGPEEVFFQVSGSADPQLMSKGGPEEKFNLVVAFDSMSTDPETAEARLKQMTGILQLDRNGRIDIDKFLEFMAMSVDPVLADYVLQPKEEAADKVMKDVTDDLAKIYAGIEVPARPNGAQVAMQMLQSYTQQEDVAQRMQNDEAFAERIQKYAGQYQFQMQQAQNAEIGKIGTAPAEMGGTPTQGMAQ